MEIISSVIPFMVMLVLGVAVPSLMVLSYQYYSLGLFLIASASIVDTLTLGVGGINVGVNLFYPDLLLGVVAIVALLRLLFAGDAPSRNLPWLVFCIAICISTATGLFSFGTAAGVAARQYFYFMVAGTYTMTFMMNQLRLRQTWAMVVITALILIGISVYRWVVYYAPIPSLLPPGGAYNVDGAIRVIYSYQALVLAEALLAGVFFTGASRAFATARAAAPFLLAAVLALQHRSVWLATIAGVLVRVFVGRKNTGSTLRQILLLLSIVAVTAVPIVVSSQFSGVTEQIGSSATRAFQKGGSGGERLQSWGEIVHNWYAAGAKSIVIGQSFGADNTRYVVDLNGASHKINYVAHNAYVQNLFSTGLIGLLAFLAANLVVLCRLYKISRDTNSGIEAELFMVLIAMQLAYYIPYGVDFFQAVIFGAAMAYTGEKRAVTAAPAAPSRSIGGFA